MIGIFFFDSFYENPSSLKITEVNILLVTQCRLYCHRDSHVCHHCWWQARNLQQCPNPTEFVLTAVLTYLIHFWPSLKVTVQVPICPPCPKTVHCGRFDHSILFCIQKYLPGQLLVHSYQSSANDSRPQSRPDFPPSMSTAVSKPALSAELWLVSYVPFSISTKKFLNALQIYFRGQFSMHRPIHSRAKSQK